jgi:hypothetical protein
MLRGAASLNRVQLPLPFGGRNVLLQGGQMITATVRYKLPPHIDHAACREHFHKIAPGFRQVKGLISKHFIWSESGWAGGVYQWETLQDAKAFYSGPWLEGIVQRYGMQPQIDFYEVFAVTDNARGSVDLFNEQRLPWAQTRNPTSHPA